MEPATGGVAPCKLACPRSRTITYSDATVASPEGVAPRCLRGVMARSTACEGPSREGEPGRGCGLATRRQFSSTAEPSRSAGSPPSTAPAAMQHSAGEYSPLCGAAQGPHAPFRQSSARQPMPGHGLRRRHPPSNQALHSGTAPGRCRPSCSQEERYSRLHAPAPPRRTCHPWVMARTWLSVTVELLGGRGEELWLWPGRVFAVGPSHTFLDLADSINNAFARWGPLASVDVYPG